MSDKCSVTRPRKFWSVSSFRFLNFRLTHTSVDHQSRGLKIEAVQLFLSQCNLNKSYPRYYSSLSFLICDVCSYLKKGKKTASPNSLSNTNTYLKTNYHSCGRHVSNVIAKSKINKTIPKCTWLTYKLLNCSLPAASSGAMNHSTLLGDSHRTLYTITYSFILENLREYLNKFIVCTAEQSWMIYIVVYLRASV